MNRRHFWGFVLLTAAMLLSGCSAEILDGGSQGLVPIELTASVTEGSAEGGTRAGTALNNSYLPSGTTFTVGFSGNTTLGSNTTTYQTTNATGATKCTGTQPYFTLGGVSTTVHAYYPSKPGSTFSVQTAQNTDANYRSSDLMYATKSLTKASPTATAALSFGHKMAKIIVNATLGSGITSITAVKIVGGYRTVNVSNTTTCTLGTTLTNANSSTNITVYSGTHTSGTLSCAALIPPQRVPTTGSTATNFLQIVTNAGTVTYSLNGKQFSSNNVYTFNVTLTASQAGTTVAITDWPDNGNATMTAGGLTLQTDDSGSNGYVTFSGILSQEYTGSAIEPKPSVNVKINNVSIPLTEGTDFDYSYDNNINKGTATVSVTGKGMFSGTVSTNFSIINCTGTALASATVGMIICNHGKAHTATTGALNCGGSKVAIIAYKGDAGTADKSSGSSSYKGLALAITDVGGATASKFQWYTESSGKCITNAQSDKVYVAFNVNDATSLGWMTGIENTNHLANAECGEGHVHAAAQAAVGYESTDPHPSGTSQWFLPTMAQWKLMLESIRKNMSSGDTYHFYMQNQDAFKNTAFQSWFDARGGKNFEAGFSYYWSSTEYNAGNAWDVTFNTGSALYDSKANYGIVRAVLAF